jgi:hypothetical protein
MPSSEPVGRVANGEERRTLDGQPGESLHHRLSLETVEVNASAAAASDKSDVAWRGAVTDRF